ncbi:MAG: nicotinate-nucleotide adenylyltransferase [Candidatus Gastranaerophilaceae bacterium]
MKLCVFQGTFNPIHNAHLRVAEYVLEHYNFDKILFIPAYNPPHKTSEPNMREHRFKIVELAIKNNPKFEISDIEYQRKGKSYTYDTICELYKNYKIDEKIHFIIGTDAFDKIETWYKFNELKKLVKFIVFIRDENFDKSRYNYLKDMDVDFECQTLEYLDISSTELRKRIAEHKNIDLLIPQEEKEYIIKNELYKI